MSLSISKHKLLDSSLLLFLSIILGWSVWNLEGFSLVIFIALIPIFKGIEQLTQGKWLVYIVYLLLFKFLWVASQVFWLKDVSFDTFTACIITHSILFVIILTPSVIAFSKKNKNKAITLFILGWILFELLMQNTSLLSPFYILGNSIGEYPLLIQNYSIIGIEGGSVWVLLVNYFGYRVLKSISEKQPIRKTAIYYGAIVILPFLISLLTTFYSERGKQIQVAVLHTNFNPVNDRYGLQPELIIDSLWNLSKEVDKKTDVLVWPETIITNLGWMQELYKSHLIDSLQLKLNDYPKMNLTFGANIHSLPTDNTDEQLNYSEEYGFYFYVHNAAFTLNKEEVVTFRSKEIFVPFQEQVPYVKQFPFLKNMISVVGNPNFYAEYANDLEIHSTMNGIKYLPLLCYEICYPQFVAKQSKDVSFITLLGNEHWNTSKKGSRIYFNILVATAIQNQIPIVKSSNNGISVILDQNGKTLASKSFDDTGIISSKIYPKEHNSIYSHISGYSYIIALILLPFILFRKEKKLES